MKDEDYIPYGPEWEKEMMKNSKATIVQITGTLGKQKDDLSETIRELKADIALLKERDEKNGEGWAEDFKKLEAENQSLRDRMSSLKANIEKEMVVRGVPNDYSNGRTFAFNKILELLDTP